MLDAFERRSIDALRPTIGHAVEALVASHAEARGGDRLQAVSFPLPVFVIGEMLGVPAADRPPFRALVADGDLGKERARLGSRRGHLEVRRPALPG